MLNAARDYLKLLRVSMGLILPPSSAAVQRKLVAFDWKIWRHTKGLWRPYWALLVLTHSVSTFSQENIPRFLYIMMKGPGRRWLAASSIASVHHVILYSISGCLSSGYFGGGFLRVFFFFVCVCVKGSGQSIFSADRSLGKKLDS